MDNEVKIREAVNEIKQMIGANDDYAPNLIAQHWRLWQQALTKTPKADYIGDILNFLGYIADFKSFQTLLPELEKYLDSPEAEYRAYAIQALGGGQFPQYLPKLARLAHIDDKNRCLLCYCLSNFPEAQGELIIKTLSWIVREKNSADQYHALQSLSYWEGPEVVNTLKWAAHNGSSEGNCRKAKELLGLYGERVTYNPRVTRETMLAMAI